MPIWMTQTIANKACLELVKCGCKSENAVVHMYLQEIKLTGHALNLVNILVSIIMMQTKMFSSFCNIEVTNKIIAGDDSLFNIPVEVHSRVSFSQFRNGVCTKCMDSLIIHER